MKTGIEKLTEREKEVAELLAWGATKKEAAEKLFLSVFTIDNHLRKIFEKTGCNKVNELSAWWFCTSFKISFDLSPLKRAVMAGVLIIAFIPSEFTMQYSKTRRTRTSRTELRIARAMSRTRRNTYNTEYYAI